MQYSPFNFQFLYFIETPMIINLYLKQIKINLMHQRLAQVISKNSIQMCPMIVQQWFLLILEYIHLLLSMLAEIPRTPIFPEHMIMKEMRRIEIDVQDDVIPVSAGIYSEHKLLEKLQAIPKPDIVNYEDPVFFQVIDVVKFPCKTSSCPLCGEQYGGKKNVAVQCNFCGVWSCQECMCPRKRFHPRAKESSSQRYTICYKCDDKFLSLTLNHGFVENKALLEEIMRRVRKQKDEYQAQCDKRQEDSNYAKDAANKNRFKISSIKKEQLDFKKTIMKLQAQREQETMKLRVREKYLAILYKKKDSLRQKAEERLSAEAKEQKQHSNIFKPVRSLSHSNVFSESIMIDVSQKQESIKDTNYSRNEQNTYSPPQQRPIEPIKQQKLNNFYNYYEWSSQQQKGVVVELEQSPTKVVQTVQIKIEPEPSTEIKVSEEVVSDQKMTKIAQIFSKPEVITKQQDYDSDDEVQSLDGQVIKIKKAALMKAAIQQSNRSRIQTMDTDAFEPDPKKCSCQIY